MKRRTVIGLCLAGPAAVAAFLAFRLPVTARPAAPAADNAASRLPVKQVVLFSSGVGFFQREGEVDGDARVDLSFPAGDVNDLIKSMTLQDLGGGLVSAVAYDSHDPVERTLKSFAVDLTSNPSLAALLDQARGEKAEIVLQQTAGQQAGTLAGAIVGVEHHKEVTKETTTDVPFLNLWCADGLRSVKLADVQRVRFLNPVLESEYRRALDTLAISHDSQKKAVSLSFTGQGRRPVRVGYVVESPVWKTSYRLSLPAAGDREHRPQLQGWAVVENPTDEDWSGVRMRLVSGRPISFKMDLYQPLYVPRPTVEPELFASLRPQTYDGDMADEKRRAVVTATAPDSGPARRPARPQPGFAGGFGGMPPGSAPMPKSDGGEAAAGRLARGRSAGEAEKQAEFSAGVQSAAQAEKLGDNFQYTLEQPVNLPRQKSALLPIVRKDVEAARVSVYSPRVHAKFPLSGLKVKNATGAHLMQGPITVFDGNTYAGDARLPDVQPGEERLVTYAVDLGTEMEAKAKNPPSRITAAKVVKGVLHSTTKFRQEMTYRGVNRSESDRTVLVEHPYREELKLVSSMKPAERTRDMYRFEVKLPAGKSDELEVAEERDLVQTVLITNSDDQSIRVLIQQPAVSAAVKDALKKSLELKTGLAKTQRELQQVDRSVKQLEQDQDRLRKNLKETPPTSNAYKRYVEKLDQQESEIEKLQAARAKLQDEEHARRTEFDNYLATLTVE